MNNIKISITDARSFRSIFNTSEWQAYMKIIHQARENARTIMESATRDVGQRQGICLAFKEICDIENNVRQILKSGKE